LKFLTEISYTLNHISNSMEARGNLITILQKVQVKEGYLPASKLDKVSEQTGIPLSEIYSVATFYSQFRLKPVGKHQIMVCNGTACHVKGGHEVLKILQKELGVEPGETTEDRLFTLDTVACLGSCFLAPVMTIDGEYYGNLDNDKAVAVLETYRK
jgi:NADH-quinone oxidoreductase subunit E